LADNSHQQIQGTGNVTPKVSLSKKSDIPPSEYSSFYGSYQ